MLKVEMFMDQIELKFDFKKLFMFRLELGLTCPKSHNIVLKK